MTSSPATSVAMIDGVDVDAVAAAVTACPGVSGLFGGRGDAIASYLPGRRVPGVEVSPASAGVPVVVVHVRCRWNVTAAQLLDQISTAVAPMLNGPRLEIVVADIDVNDTDVNDAPVTLQTAATVTELETVPPVPMPGAVDAEPSAHRSPGSSPLASAANPTPAPPTFRSSDLPIRM